jgi:hypothetical protein
MRAQNFRIFSWEILSAPPVQLAGQIGAPKLRSSRDEKDQSNNRS